MDTGNKTAVFYITNGSFALAQKLRKLYPDADVFKFSAERVATNWKRYKNLIFIMSTGIVVRVIAHLIQDKRTDPAVIVLDEKGRFAISLLSGHLGGANDIAREIAGLLDGEAVITTASDVNNLPSIDLWARKNDLMIDDWESLPRTATKFINNGTLRIYSEIQVEIPEEFLKTDDPECADVSITNKKRTHRDSEGSLYLRPKNLVLGIGCNSGTDTDEIEDAVRKVLDRNNLAFSAIHSVATIDKKGKEPGLVAFAQKYGFKINTFTPDELNTVEWIPKSEIVFKYTGARAVSEPAAILASGADEFLVPKQKMGNVTVAVAELKSQNGKIYVVGTGPGDMKYITPKAQNAIKEADVIIGYRTYIELIPGLVAGKEVISKEVISSGMGQEIERCKKTLEMASRGKIVALISNGDPGIYAMAGPMLEILNSENLPLEVEVIPGVSALNACAAKLGAPLMHDFASISLSDRLTPWEVIETRLEAACKADFVIVLYNPRSMGRPEHIDRARKIIIKHRKPETPVGIVKAATREGEKIVITDLENMLGYEIDMQSTVIIGNSRTFVFDNYLVTPRGYEKKYKFS
jgi:cobalt-precorrin 5A hydrolase/precorrin-3B C17-methyltransferase